MNWDTLIVGGGSAGCVLAARLSEDPTHRVLLLEAGPAHDPEALPEQVEYLGRGYAWPIEWGEEVQSSDGRALPYLRGRGIGGSSSINGGVAMRAEPSDLANWPAGWQWDAMLPWLCRVENDRDFGSEVYHGSDGPIPIARFGREDWDPTYQAFHAACLEAGLPDCEDQNAPNTTGVGAIPMNRDGGRRLFAGITHLFPALGRDNLSVRAEAAVDRVLFDGRRAVGVELANGETLSAERVILAAGVLHTPLLLWRSGIGPADRLKARGLTPRIDLPGVGRHWTDHMVIQLSTPLDPRFERPGRHGIQVLARLTAEGSPFENDLQITPWCEKKSDGQYHLNLSVSLQQPFGEATIEVANADPESRGLFSWPFPGEPRNIERLRFGYRMAAKILATAGISTSPEAHHTQASQDDQEIDAWIAENHGAFYHGVGSCRMGDDETSPLDSSLRVRETEACYVIDGSSIPRVTRSNTHLIIAALAERAAAMLTESEAL